MTPLLDCLCITVLSLRFTVRPKYTLCLLVMQYARQMELAWPPAFHLHTSYPDTSYADASR